MDSDGLKASVRTHVVSIDQNTRRLESCIDVDGEATLRSSRDQHGNAIGAINGVDEGGSDYILSRIWE